MGEEFCGAGLSAAVVFWNVNVKLPPTLAQQDPPPQTLACRGARGRFLFGTWCGYGGQAEIKNLDVTIQCDQNVARFKSR
jgi:hypothetical protein